MFLKENGKLVLEGRVVSEGEGGTLLTAGRLVAA